MEKKIKIKEKIVSSCVRSRVRSHTSERRSVFLFNELNETKKSGHKKMCARRCEPTFQHYKVQMHKINVKMCVCVCVFEIEPKLKSAIWSTKTFTPGHQIDHWMKHLNNCVIINCIHDPLSPTITINIHFKGFQHCHQHSFRLPFFFCFGRVCLSETLYRHFGDDKFSWHTCKQIGNTLVC